MGSAQGQVAGVEEITVWGGWGGVVGVGYADSSDWVEVGWLSRRGVGVEVEVVERFS